MRTCFGALLMIAGLTACDGLHDPSLAGNLVPRTVDEDPTLPSIALAGTVFHAEAFGDPNKPVVIFLHGGPGGDYRDFLRLNGALRRLRADGRSPRRLLGPARQRPVAAPRLRRLHPRAHGRRPGRADRPGVARAAGDPDRPQLGRHVRVALHQPPPRQGGGRRVHGARPAQRRDVRFSIIDDLYDIDPFSEWLNDVVWDGQFLTADDHARADYHRMLGVRDAQPKYHQTRPTRRWSGAWARSRTAACRIGDQGRQGGLRLHRSPGRVYEAACCSSRARERSHRRRVPGTAAAVLSRRRTW